MTDELSFAVEEMEDMDAPHNYYVLWGTVIFAVSYTAALIIWAAIAT